jgi:hypothetical protein
MNSSPTVAAAAANRMSPAAHRLRCPLIEPAKASIAKFVCNVFKPKIVVEAAGVEPASENVTGQETTCLFAFMPRALGVSTLPKTFAAHAQNGQETLAASLRS